MRVFLYFATVGGPSLKNGDPGARARLHMIEGVPSSLKEGSMKHGGRPCANGRRKRAMNESAVRSLRLITSSHLAEDVALRAFALSHPEK